MKAREMMLIIRNGTRSLEFSRACRETRSPRAKYVEHSMNILLPELPHWGEEIQVPNIQESYSQLISEFGPLIRETPKIIEAGVTFIEYVYTSSLSGMIVGRKKLGQSVVGISAIDKVVARPCDESLVGDWTASLLLVRCLAKVTLYPSWNYSGNTD